MRRIFLFAILYNFSVCFSQVSADFTFQSGKIIKNYPAFPQRDFAFIQRFSFNKKLNGSAPWHRYYYYPEFKIQSTFGSLGNKKELGSIAGLNGGLGFQHDVNSRFTFLFDAGFGAAYFNKPYDEVKNPGNIAIGASVTALATADVGLLYHLHPYWSLIAKASVLHCSDSHYTLPNLGINLPMISIGVRYRPVPPSIRIERKDTTAIDKKPKLVLRLALGMNEQGGSTGPVNGPKYPVYLGALYIYKHYNPIARWQTGLEAYYNEGTYTYITSQQFYSEKEKIRSCNLIYILGNEFIFGNVSMVTQGGVYLYNKFGYDLYKYHDGNFRDYLKTLITARLGFQYYAFNTYYQKHNNVFVGWFVKTNFGQADFMEMSLGYNF